MQCLSNRSTQQCKWCRKCLCRITAHRSLYKTATQPQRSCCSTNYCCLNHPLSCLSDAPLLSLNNSVTHHQRCCVSTAAASPPLCCAVYLDLSLSASSHQRCCCVTGCCCCCCCSCCVTCCVPYCCVWTSTQSSTLLLRHFLLLLLLLCHLLLLLRDLLLLLLLLLPPLCFATLHHTINLLCPSHSISTFHSKVLIHSPTAEPPSQSPHDLRFGIRLLTLGKHHVRVFLSFVCSPCALLVSMVCVRSMIGHFSMPFRCSVLLPACV